MASQASGLAGLITLGLALARVVLQPDTIAANWVLALAGLGFLGSWAVARAGHPVATRWLTPGVGLLSAGLFAAAEGGLTSESVLWMPFVPLIAVLLLDRRAALWFAAAALLVVSLLATEHLLYSERLLSLTTDSVLLHWASVAGAIVFSTVLGLAYERGRHAASQNLEHAHERLQALVHNLQAGVAITDEHARLVSINQKLCDIFGLEQSPDELAGENTWKVIKNGQRPVEEWALFKRRIVEIATRGEPAEDEVRMADGTVYERDFTPLNLDGNTQGHLWSYHDITEHKIREERLLSRVQRDALTGLASRSHFQECLGEACSGADPVALLYIDLDGFKAINDTHGHEAGDQVLAAIGERFRSLLRRTDLAARIGGDEFAVLLDGALDISVATRVADKLIEAASMPIDLSGLDARVGASIGVVFEDCGCGPEAIMQAADQAMYQAKRAGKGGYRIAS